MGWGIVERLLFPAPHPSYDRSSFPGELLFLPPWPQDGSVADCRMPPSADARRASFAKLPECTQELRVARPAFVPCLFLKFPTARFVVLYLHSNAEDLGKCRSFLQSLCTQFQVHVLAVEYPGYGIAPGGQCDERGASESALAAVRFVRETLRWPLDSIIVLGRSIGCGPAIQVAMHYEVAGLVLVSPMLSFKELMKDMIGSLPASTVEDRFLNRDCIGHVRSSLLVVHGQQDAVIPFRHGVDLFKASFARKLLVTPPEMAHNSDLMSDVSYLVLPMLQFFPIPDYSFEDIAVPSWAYKVPVGDDGEEVQGWIDRPCGAAGCCLHPKDQEGQVVSVLRWLLALPGKQDAAEHCGLADLGPEAPHGQRSDMPRALSAKIFVGRPDTPCSSPAKTARGRLAGFDAPPRSPPARAARGRLAALVRPDGTAPEKEEEGVCTPNASKNTAALGREKQPPFREDSAALIEKGGLLLPGVVARSASRNMLCEIRGCTLAVDPEEFKVTDEKVEYEVPGSHHIDCAAHCGAYPAVVHCSS